MCCCGRCPADVRCDGQVDACSQDLTVTTNITNNLRAPAGYWQRLESGGGRVRSFDAGDVLGRAPLLMSGDLFVVPRRTK